jgi:hypothetical protein
VVIRAYSGVLVWIELTIGTPWRRAKRAAVRA